MLSDSCAAVVATAQVAQPAPWESMGSRFRRGGPRSDGVEALWALVGLAAAVSVAVLVSRWFNGAHTPRRYANPRKLFHALAKAHGLLPSERRLAWALARRHGLEHPALVFVDRRYWRSEGQIPSAAEAELLARIEQRLFRDSPNASLSRTDPGESTLAPLAPSAAPASPAG